MGLAFSSSYYFQPYLQLFSPIHSKLQLLSVASNQPSGQLSAPTFPLLQDALPRSKSHLFSQPGLRCYLLHPLLSLPPRVPYPSPYLKPGKLTLFRISEGSNYQPFTHRLISKTVQHTPKYIFCLCDKKIGIILIHSHRMIVVVLAVVIFSLFDHLRERGTVPLTK